MMTKHLLFPASTAFHILAIITLLLVLFPIIKNNYATQKIHAAIGNGRRRFTYSSEGISG